MTLLLVIWHVVVQVPIDNTKRSLFFLLCREAIKLWNWLHTWCNLDSPASAGNQKQLGRFPEHAICHRSAVATDGVHHHIDISPAGGNPAIDLLPLEIMWSASTFILKGAWDFPPIPLLLNMITKAREIRPDSSSASYWPRQLWLTDCTCQHSPCSGSQTAQTCYHRTSDKYFIQTQLLYNWQPGKGLLFTRAGHAGTKQEAVQEADLYLQVEDIFYMGCLTWPRVWASFNTLDSRLHVAIETDWTLSVWSKCIWQWCQSTAFDLLTSSGIEIP